MERALRLTREALAEGKQLVSLGPLIHNAQVVAELEAQGLRHIDAIEQAQGASLLIRTHGVSTAVLENAQRLGLDIIDATCPFVRRAHRRAQELEEAGYVVCVLGDRSHPEVLGIAGSVRGECHVLETPADAEMCGPFDRVGLVAQTTQTVGNYRGVVGALAARSQEILAHNTLCDATSKRQDAARDLADQCDVVLVVGGRHSANTRRLHQICEEAGVRSHHIETADEVEAPWLADAMRIGVTAGASTPEAEIEAVEARVRALCEEREDPGA